MSPKKSPSAFVHDHHHRSDSPPPSSPTNSRRRRSPARYSSSRSAMQTSTQSYPNDAAQQRNGRRGIVLPPGKNDLEILENLKQIIKNGQHEFYKAIPQPAALASLYLGTIPTTEPGSKATEDVQAKPKVQDEPHKEIEFPVEQGIRPPRFKGKESWDSASSRRPSTSRVDEQQAVATNGHRNEAPEDVAMASIAAHQTVSEFVPPPSATDAIPANGSLLTPPNDSRPPTRDRTEIIPASDDSSTAVATSPVKVASSPMSQIDAQDRDRNYSSRPETSGYAQPSSYSRDDKREDYVGDRYRRDSYARSNDRYPPRNAENNWRSHSQQRPYKSNYDASSRSYVKTEEVPISLSDLDSRGPFPPAVSGSAPSQNAPRNGNGVQSTERSFVDVADSAPSDVRGLPPGLSTATTPNGQYNSGRPTYDASTPTTIKSEQAPPRRDSRGDGPLTGASVEQGGRSVPSHSDSARVPPSYKDNRYAPRPSDRYRRPGSPGYSNSRPPIDRDDVRGPPPRDYRPPPAPPKSVSRERDYRPPPSNNYRPEYDERRIERIDVDNDPRYNDSRQYRGFSPPTPQEMARDRERQIQHRFPVSPRAAASEVPYESPSARRYNGAPPPSSSTGGAPPHSAAERDWYPPQSAQSTGAYPPQRWEEEPYYPSRDRPANWDAAADRGRYEPEAPPRRWEDRDARDARDTRDTYRGPPPASAPVNDRYADRARPPPPPAAHGPPPYSRVRPRSPSPIRTGSRPPMKRQRDDYPVPPPPSSSDYYSPHAPAIGPRDPPRGRPTGDAYHSGAGGRGVSPLGPPPSSGGSTFYDRSGPPPSTSTSTMSVDRDRLPDRGRTQDRSRLPPRDFMAPPPRHRDDEYHPHAPSLSQSNGPPGGSLYDRPRSPPGGRPSMPPPSVRGDGGPGGRGASSSGGGGYRGGYRAPPPRDSRGYMPPPASRP